MTIGQVWLGFGLAMLVACGRPLDFESGAVTDDIRSTIISLQVSQMSGIERHDLAAYLAVFAEEATLTVGRGAVPGPFDRTLTQLEIVATRTERFDSPPQGEVRLRHRAVEVERESGRLIVRWVAERTSQDGVDSVREVFVLRPARPVEGHGWRVVHNRLWPLWQQDAGQPVVRYDAATWALLDAGAARRGCDGGPCPAALLAAWRFVEAHEAAIRLTTQLPRGAKGEAAAALWAMRGLCAVFCGRVGDAQPSFSRALVADAAVELPPWRSAVAARREVTPEAIAPPGSAPPL